MYNYVILAYNFNSINKHLYWYQKKKKKKKVDLKGVRNNVPKGCSKNCEMN